ncbi:MAG TPA: RNA polymerase sigma factor [Thermoanaerobaculia bacterium]
MDGRDSADAQEVAADASDAQRRDRDLVDRYLRTRDETAFLNLYRSHTPALLGLAARLCAGELPAAEEIVQEAWVRAAQSLPSFRWESRLRTWLSGVVVNSWRDRARARGREESWEAGFDSIPADVTTSERLDLERAVAQLPDGFRAVLLLHDVEGFTHLEIATLLGIEAGTSKSQLARARQAVRRRLSGAPAVFPKGERSGRSTG